MGPALKHCKVPRYYDQNCLKVSVLISRLHMMIPLLTKSVHFSLKMLILSENCKYVKSKTFESQILMQTKYAK